MNWLGLKILKEDTCPIQVASRITHGLGEATIDLLTPNGEGSVQKTLTEDGEGPFTLYFKVQDLDQTLAFLEEQEVAFTHEGAGLGKLVVDPSETLGVRINFVP